MQKVSPRFSASMIFGGMAAWRIPIFGANFPGMEVLM